MSRLTTTSYAVLGLLAVRPWSTYELAQQMDRSLRNFWPRAQSKVYEEPKKLAALGLAKVRDERTGKRPRTVYAITAKGRTALAAWLDEPPAPPQLSSEQLLKVFFADAGTIDQLLATIGAVKEHAEAEIERGKAFIDEYDRTGGPFPNRLPLIALMVRFLSMQDETLLRWAQWAEGEVRTWSGFDECDGRALMARVAKEATRDVDGDRID